MSTSLDLISVKDVADFKRLSKLYRNYELVDIYEDLNNQYKLVNNPKLYFSSQEKSTPAKDKFAFMKSLKQISRGCWFISRKEKKIYHILDKKRYLELRTTRNRNLITAAEQAEVYNKSIAVIGMSVGSQMLNSLVRLGIGNNYIILDGDVVELHNINRTIFTLGDLGRRKVDVIKDYLLSVDPFLKIQSISDNLSENNIKKIIAHRDLIIDCFDNFELKILLREIARSYKIPVISGFDVSRGAMLIVERYDTEENLDLRFFLNGYTKKDILALSGKGIEERTEMFVKIIGKKYHDARMLKSVYQVGKVLTGYPQIIIATNLASSLWCVAVLDVLLKRSTKSLRLFLDLNKIVSKNNI